MNSSLGSLKVAGRPSGTLTRRAFGVGALAAGVAVATGCSGSEGGSAASGDGKTRKVTFLTTFGNQGRDAYSYVAAEKGFFAEAGLEVEIQLGKAGDYNHGLLQTGTAQFATVDAAGAVLRYANGKDTSFQMLAAIHQSAVVGILGLEGGPIRSPKDLEGKNIGMVKGAVAETLFPGYAKLAGVDPKKVIFKYGDPAQMNSLLATGALPGVALFVFGAPGVEAAAKKKAVILPYSDYLTDLYGAALVAQKSTIDREPDLARRFTSALLKGLQYAVDNPEEAGQILEKRGGQKAAVAAAELQQMKAYVSPSSATPIGSFDQARVARMVASLEANQLIPAGMNPRLPDQIVRFELAPKA
jgi:NitT/TauT family transport system substrate-binding protein